MEKKEIKENECRRGFLCSIIVILTFITIGICALIIVEIQKNETRSKMECQAYFLKEFYITDESFDSIADFAGDDEKCIYEIENKIKIIINETKERLNTQTNHRAVTICIEKQIDDKSYYYKILLLEIIDFSKISWTFWKYFKRTENYNALIIDINKTESEAFEHCKIDRNFKPTLLIDGSGDGYGDEEDYNEEEYFENPRRTKRFLSNNANNDDLYFVQN